MRSHYDVVIVGYGPVGQTLAILLGQRGWSVGVFEKQQAAYPLPRAVHFDHEIGRILQAAGVADRLDGCTEVADAYEWRNAAGDTLLRFESEPTSLSGWPEANMFAQPELEALLDVRVRTLSAVEVHRGHEVVALDTSGPEPGLAVHEAGTGRRHAVRARRVIGCDGANSFVRTAIDATVTDLGFFFDWLIVDVRPHRPSVWRPLNVQICDPARPTTLVSGGPGRRRWGFMRLPGESLEEMNSAATAWRLLAPWDVTPRNATLERHVVYRFQARWTDTWRRGHVLLAGDAAHQMPPFAGQGMCSGLRDAINLAWKLDRVFLGSDDALLDTYASERIPHVRAMIDFSMALGQVICIPDPAAAAARDAAMLTDAAAGRRADSAPLPALGPGVFVADSPQAGRLFVQGRVQHGDAVGRFDDVVGRGWTLVSPHGDPAAHLHPAAREFFRGLGGVSAHVAPGAGVDDLDGAYARWFARAGVAVALQRPDFYVFGTGADLDDASRLVADLRRQLLGE